MGSGNLDRFFEKYDSADRSWPFARGSRPDYAIRLEEFAISNIWLGSVIQSVLVTAPAYLLGLLLLARTDLWFVLAVCIPFTAIMLIYNVLHNKWLRRTLRAPSSG